MQINQKIRLLRELRGKKQEEMSDALGISQGAYSKLENSTTEISYSRLEKIAEILSLTVDYIVSFDGNAMLNKPGNSFTEAERKAMEDHIKTLKEEIKYLKIILDKHT